MVEIIDAAAAARLIRDGYTVYIGGSGGGHAVPEAIIDALRDRHASTQEPRGLTLASTVSIGDWDTTGFNKLADPNLVTRVISAGFNNCPAIAALAIADEIEAYTLPQGALSQLCRDMAAGRPGLLTKTGLHTFVDPRYGGGKQSRRAKEDLVKLVEIDGEEYLLYRAFPIDVAVIRGTIADERGNLSMEEEAFLGENFSLAAAAKLRGGIVIAQVQRLAASGSLTTREVRVPAPLVDYIVIEPNQRQTYQTQYDPAFAGRMRMPDSAMQPLAFDIRKVIARRAAMELVPNAVVNLGFGVSNGISAVAAEEGFYRELTLTVEQGIIGGVPSGGKNAGAGVNFDMMAAQPDQFDFYDGGGLDIAFLSFAEVDRNGNVNVSRYGKSVNGPGGFINISQGARKVVFSGTLTTGGLVVAPDGEGGLKLERDGAVGKWLYDVQQVTFNGRFACQRGQEVVFITDRAVFRLTPNGIRLTEVAAGISVQRDILDRIAFPVQVASELAMMDKRLFRPQQMGLAADFRAQAPAGRRCAKRC
ncbi:MAG: acyl CoA:acetate/3-ketoacid CoA transferase [Variibacter sp.]